MSGTEKAARRAGSGALAALLALALALAAPAGAAGGAQEAWAAETASITVSNATDGGYFAYKLMDGSFTTSDDGEALMGDAYLCDATEELLLEALSDWGHAVETEGRSDRAVANDAMDAICAIEGEGKAQAFANDLAGRLEEAGVSADAEATASAGAVSFTGLGQGYWLVAQEGTEDDAMTSAILVPLSGDVEVDAKVTTPSPEKYALSDDGETWVLSDDTGVYEGDDGKLAATTLSYRIVGTVASNIEDYDSYYYAFVDELPSGFALDSTSRIAWSVTASLGGSTATLTSSFGCSAVLAGGQSTVTWACSDLLAALEAAFPEGDLSEAQIILEYSLDYTAEEVEALFSTASSLDEPQTNSVHLEFSNNPYSNGTGSTSESTEDEARHYSYNLQILKVDEDGTTALSGAVFALTDSEGKVMGNQIVADSNGSFTFTGLEAGVEYTLTETSVPKGHKSIDPIRFTISATTNATTGLVEAISVEEVDDPTGAATWTTDGATAQVTVVNLDGDDMPLTGLAGIAGGCAAGGALVALGAALWARGKRRGHTAGAAR